MGDLQIGVKYRFLEESATRPEIAVFPSTSLPTGNQQMGLGLGHPQTFLPIWAQKSAGPWTLFGGGGLHVNPGAGNRNWWYSGATLTRKVTPQISVGGEVYHTTANAIGAAGSTGFNFGFVRNIDGRHALLLSAGRAMNFGNAFQLTRLMRSAFFHERSTVFKGSNGTVPIATQNGSWQIAL